MTTKLSPINKCSDTSSLCNYWEFQINNEYMTQNNFWFRVEEDVTLSDGGQISIEVNAEDGTTSQAGRQSDSVTGFKETVEFTFVDGSAYAFNRAMSSVLNAGDDYKMDYLECGMNARKIICYPNGSMKTKTYLGCATTDIQEPLTAIQNADAEWGLSLTLPEPTVDNIGGIGALPNSVNAPILETSYVFDAENDSATLSATITSDEDNIIVPTTPIGEEIRVDAFNQEGEYLTYAYVDSTLTFPLGIEVGDSIKLAWNYHIFDDSTGARIYYTDKVEDVIVE